VDSEEQMITAMKRKDYSDNSIAGIDVFIAVIVISVNV
jgi:hypothetical protein